MKETLHERSMRLLRLRLRRLRSRKDFKFVFLGDSRGTSNECFLSGEFELVLRQAAARKPLFIVHGGDTVFTGERAFMEHFVQVVKKIAPHIPMFVCVGNHDEQFIGVSNTENFEATIGQIHWRINVPKFHFQCIALNDVINPGKPGVPAVYGFTPSELDYLEMRLAKSPRNTLLAMHAEPGVGRWAKADGFPPEQSIRFFQLLEQHRNKVKKVLVSHVHAYDEQFIELNPVDNSIVLAKGIDYVLSGGAGAPLETDPFILNQYHFVEFTVNKHRVSSPQLFKVLGTPRTPCL